MLFSAGWAVLAAALLLAGCGGSRPQSAACSRFVSCVAALDANRGRQTNVERFVVGGACWGGQEAGATLCTEACERGLPVLVRGLAIVPGACQ